MRYIIPISKYRSRVVEYDELAPNVDDPPEYPVPLIEDEEPVLEAV